MSGEAAILNLKSGIYYGLNAAGATIWEMLKDPVSVAKVRDSLLEEYQVERERCEQDLLILLEELAAKGLIEVLDDKDKGHDSKSPSGQAMREGS